MGFHNSHNYRQTHAPASKLTGKKRVEEMLDILILDSTAFIRHFQAGVGSVLWLPIAGKTMR